MRKWEERVGEGDGEGAGGGRGKVREWEGWREGG